MSMGMCTCYAMYTNRMPDRFFLREPVTRVFYATVKPPTPPALACLFTMSECLPGFHGIDINTSQTT